MIPLQRYQVQAPEWPRSGRHILAHYDETTIVVYQAYRPSIGSWAIANGRLGGPEFSLSRMSWIKPNFLWMMFRSGWGQKEGQECVLGLRLRREFFDDLLRHAVSSTFDPHCDHSQAEWQARVRRSNVRLQWDPDHLPNGAPTERRAIQLGLRGDTLHELAGQALLEVIDMSELVSAGRKHLSASQPDLLETPVEREYAPPPDALTVLGVADIPPA
jgi:hypothetical protein